MRPSRVPAGKQLGNDVVQLLQKAFHATAYMVAIAAQGAELFMGAFQVSGLLIKQLLQRRGGFFCFLAFAALAAYQLYHAHDALFEGGKVIRLRVLCVLVRVHLRGC